MDWPKYRKRLSRLQTRVESDAVRLSCYKSSPFYAVSEESGSALDIHVFRKRLPGFEFGLDYDEFFDGISHEEADTVIETSVTPYQNRKLTLRDDDVEGGATYAYWVVPADGDNPIGPSGVTVRNPDVWWPMDRLSSRVAELRERFPGMIDTETAGQTCYGTDLLGLRTGNRDRSIGVIGAIHAGESGPELLVPAIERLLEEDPELLDQVGMAVLPVVNADYRKRQVEGCPWYLRTNPHGVDLNRNFDADWSTSALGYGQDSTDEESNTYRGAAPHSEPETKAVVNFLESVDPLAVFSYHWMASLTGGRCLAPGDVSDDEFEARCRELVAEFTSGLYDSTESPRIAFSSSPGSLRRWVHQRFDVPGFDVEGHKGQEALERAQTDRTTPGDIEEWQRRHARGLRAILEFFAPS